MRIFSHLSTKTLTNEYVVSDENNNAIIIDPSAADNPIITIIEDHKLTIKGYLITHNHQDQIAGFGTFQKIYPAPVFASDYTISEYKTIPLRDRDKIKIGELEITAYSCAGHSNDSMVFKIGSAIFTGDTLYAGTIADTASNFDKELLLKNIREKILSQSANTLIFPARGPLSKVRIERIFNIDLLESDATYL